MVFSARGWPLILNAGVGVCGAPAAGMLRF
jgi:hypothetical protein